jgi:hypothetical protein
VLRPGNRVGDPKVVRLERLDHQVEEATVIDREVCTSDVQDADGDGGKHHK